MPMKKFLLSGFQKYYAETPTANKCIKYLNNKYPYIMPRIDHIAYRQLGNVKPLQKLLIDSDYHLMDKINLPTENLDFPKTAFWYKHPYFPRIFLSSIELKNLPSDLILKINDYKNIDTYNQLIEHDQYLAWTYFWKNDINHIAIDLSAHPDDFNEIIENMEKDINLKMNSGILDNKFQISFDGHLTQCSTKSDYSENIPKSYIEFVHREILPCNKTKLFPSSIHRKDGFDALNANTIFKSTDI
jgi:hypothetical protein